MTEKEDQNQEIKEENQEVDQVGETRDIIHMSQHFPQQSMMPHPLQHSPQAPVTEISTACSNKETDSMTLAEE